MKGFYKEMIVVARRVGQRDVAFPLSVSAKETKEEALEKVMPDILAYIDNKALRKIKT